VTASVVRNDAIAVGKEEQRLSVPVVRRQMPAVVIHNGLGVLRVPVFLENLCTVFARNHWYVIPLVCLGVKLSKPLSPQIWNLFPDCCACGHKPTWRGNR